jgi:putative membrane protein
MKLLIRILITALLVMLLATFMKKSIVVDEFASAIYVAIVLGLLNIFVKPIFVFFTLPVTFITLGLFLLVINAVMVMICDYFVSGFHVYSFWSALWFSVLLSVSQSIVYKLIEKKQ